MTGLVIGFGHVARVGKDLAATALTTLPMPRQFKRIGFADSLKQLALEADPLIEHEIRGFGKLHLSDVVKRHGWEQAKDEYPEVRRFLEKIGAAARSVLGQDVWLGPVLAAMRPNRHLVIPDVRHLNEALAIQAAGGKVVRIDRPHYSASPDRPSEMHLAEWDGWDAVIQNDGSSDNLRVAVRKLAHEYMGQTYDEPSPVEPPNPALMIYGGIW
jgi:hypothetical protein